MRLIAAMVAFLPILSAMPCLCSPPPQKKSCCCNKSEPKQSQSCCCIVKDKAKYTFEAPSLPTDELIVALVTEPSRAAESVSASSVPAVDTGPPPDPSVYQTVCSLRL
jgi:hypothetical protein